MPRSALAVLNELSIPDQGRFSDAELESLIRELVDTLRAARRVRPDLALVSQQNFPTIPVGQNGLTLAAFLQQRGGRSRELLRFTLGMLNHAPFSNAPSTTLPEDDEEFLCGERRADGLGLAASNKQLATSLGLVEWQESTVAIERRWLEEKDDGVLESAEPLNALQVASVEHVTVHEQFLRELSLPDPITGPALWADREQVFPSLEFLPRVKGQMTRLAPGSAALAQVVDRLRELDEAAANWDPRATPHPQWKSNVTPDSSSRKRRCDFVDIDGTTRCFDLHARFTPGLGRIHFRLEPEGRARLIVAHIGRKL
jgi:hypothetical protein